MIPTLFCALWFLSGPRAYSSFQRRLGARGREAWDVEVVGRPHRCSNSGPHGARVGRAYCIVSYSVARMPQEKTHTTRKRIPSEHSNGKVLEH